MKTFNVPASACLMALLLKAPEAEGKPGAFCQWGADHTVRTKR